MLEICIGCIGLLLFIAVGTADEDSDHIQVGGCDVAQASHSLALWRGAAWFDFKCLFGCGGRLKNNGEGADYTAATVQGFIR